MDFEIKDGILMKYSGSNTNTITIPSDVNTISDDAFKGCNGLTEVVIPEHIKRIGQGSFYRCGNLKRVAVQGQTEIGAFAFGACVQLEEVRLSDDIKVIGRNAFEGCSALKSIRLPSGIEAIEESLFRDCINLDNITIPEHVHKLGHYAFSRCRSLTQIDIPQSVQYIGMDVFRNCENLRNVKLPDGLTEIKPSLFESSGIEKIELPDEIKDIGTAAFDDCPNLEEIALPSSLKTIGFSFLYRSDKANKIVFKHTVPTVYPDFWKIITPKNIYISEDQLDIAKALAPKAKFYNLDGQLIWEPVKNAPKTKSSSPKPSVPVSFKAEDLHVSYGMYWEYLDADIVPLVMSGGKAKAFIKPPYTDLTVEADKVKFTVTLKISSKLPSMFRRYYLTKEDGVAYDPETVLKKVPFSRGYTDDRTGVFIGNPLEGNIPENADPLSPDEVEKRLITFVTILNHSVRSENVKKIMMEAEKKKNGRLYKGRILHLAYLDLVDEAGDTYELVAKNEGDTDMTLEVRAKVPVTDDLLGQKFLLQ